MKNYHYIYLMINFYLIEISFILHQNNKIANI